MKLGITTIDAGGPIVYNMRMFKRLRYAISGNRADIDAQNAEPNVVVIGEEGKKLGAEKTAILMQPWAVLARRGQDSFVAYTNPISSVGELHVVNRACLKGNIERKRRAKDIPDWVPILVDDTGAIVIASVDEQWVHFIGIKSGNVIYTERGAFAIDANYVPSVDGYESIAQVAISPVDRERKNLHGMSNFLVIERVAAVISKIWVPVLITIPLNNTENRELAGKHCALWGITDHCWETTNTALQITITPQSI